MYIILKFLYLNVVMTIDTTYYSAELLNSFQGIVNHINSYNNIDQYIIMLNKKIFH
jgi:hypothetical protein